MLRDFYRQESLLRLAFGRFRPLKYPYDRQWQPRLRKGSQQKEHKGEIPFHGLECVRDDYLYPLIERTERSSAHRLLPFLPYLPISVASATLDCGIGDFTFRRRRQGQRRVKRIQLKIVAMFALRRAWASVFAFSKIVHSLHRMMRQPFRHDLGLIGHNVPHKPMSEPTSRRIGIVYYRHDTLGRGTPSIFSVGLMSLPSHVERSGMFPPSLKSGLLRFMVASRGIFALTTLLVRLTANVKTARRVFIGASSPTIARFSVGIRRKSPSKGAFKARSFSGWALGASSIRRRLTVPPVGESGR
jgi:hypothetical protein